jgi:predicted lipoprotein with Yx(FWY)xxD motif
MKRILVALTACAAIIVGCGDDSDEPTANEETRQAETAQQAAASPEEPSGEAKSAARRAGPRVKLRDSQLGPVLFDGRNRALYYFTRDARNRSRCYGECAVAWPPFYATGRTRAARGVDRSLLGTVKRRDGRRQVTYKGRPLYFYIDDPRGQVLCNNVPEFGGIWYALNAEGDRPA